MKSNNNFKRPVLNKSVEINDEFWGRYIGLVKNVVILYQWDVLNDRVNKTEPVMLKAVPYGIWGNPSWYGARLMIIRSTVWLWRRMERLWRLGNILQLISTFFTMVRLSMSIHTGTQRKISSTLSTGQLLGLVLVTTEQFLQMQLTVQSFFSCMEL